MINQKTNLIFFTFLSEVNIVARITFICAFSSIVFKEKAYGQISFLFD